MDRKTVPLYRKIKDDLSQKIQTGAYKINQVIPKETELCKKYRASIITIRRAVSELVAEGMLEKIQGHGTFVRQAVIRKELGSIISFSEDMKNRGLKAGTKVLSKEVITAPSKLKKALNLKGAEQVIRIKRVRFANQVPVMYEVICLPYGLCHQVLGQDLGKKSLHGYLMGKLGFVFARAAQSIQAIIVDREKADLLEMNRGKPALLVAQTIYTDKNRIIEYNEAVYRSDKYAFAAQYHLQ